jgi:peptide-methionine (S)-S-oxide reductase
MIHNLESKETAVFGGGCFWCTEAIFASLKGVISVLPGYSGGKIPNPSYEQVSDGNTGHVECAKIEFDPKIISYSQLLKVFFETHDPTTVNRQGNDVGTQYQSTIFYITSEQKEIAQKYVNNLNKQNFYGKKVATEIRKLEDFYVAEDYHQKYYENHKDAPYCQLVIEPKLDKLKDIRLD